MHLANIAVGVVVFVVVRSCASEYPVFSALGAVLAG